MTTHCMERVGWESLAPYGPEIAPVICGQRAVRRWIDTTGQEQAACRHHEARRRNRYPERQPEPVR